MKYILMLSSTKAGFATYAAWPKKDIEANMRFMRGLSKELAESGELVTTQGLGWPGGAVLVQAGKDGAPVTDGLFPEAKEFLAGFYIVDVASAERAYEIAARWSAAPGLEGKPCNMPIEVRPVMSREGEDLP